MKSQNNKQDKVFLTIEKVASDENGKAFTVKAAGTVVDHIACLTYAVLAISHKTGVPASSILKTCHVSMRDAGLIKDDPDEKIDEPSEPKVVNIISKYIFRG